MEEERKPRRWRLWIATGLALLVAYPLSMGPAMRIAVKQKSGFYLKYFRRTYAPLRWVVSKSPNFADNLLDRYLEWWIVDLFRKP